MTGRRIDAGEAERVGLVNKVYPAELLDEKAFELATEIIEKAVSEAVRDTKFMLRSLAQNGDRP